TIPLVAGPLTEKRDLCVTHKEKLHLFCKDDKELMCWVCEKSAKHKGHSVLPLEEAAPVYRVGSNIYNIQDAYDLSCMEAQEPKTEKEKMVTTFKELRQYLEEQEKRLLAQMQEVMEKIERGKENHLDKLAEELRSLENTIQETEKKLHQPALDLLQVSPGAKDCPVKKFICPMTDLTEVVSSVLFKDPRTFVLETRTPDICFSLILFFNPPTANVHFNPETAHPTLIVSEDCKSVRCTEVWQDVPDNPDRFTKLAYVLGREKFTAGRHFWEVFVGPEESWAVGVVRNSLERKGKNIPCPEQGIWYMGKWEKAYRNGSSVVLSLNKEPKKIRVALNCEGGRLAFYDADIGTQIFVYSGAPFMGETLRPFCYCFKNGHCISTK
uniref:B30.2/SPRY domain-containing protein n=1 Tax=Salvator merianae TaxID=96440 RepID=A0A8D0DT73_SALMN